MQSTRTLIGTAGREVWQASSLRQALGDRADELLGDASETVFERGELIYDMSRGDPARLFLLVDGLVRVYYTSLHGRQATVRYGTAGDTLSLPVILAPVIIEDDRMLALQALSKSRVIEFSFATFKRVAQSDARNMWPLFNLLAATLADGQRVLSQNVFQPVRARVARHVLDLAESGDEGLTVSASQQDIADAIGSVREVVSRVLVQFRDEGHLRRQHGVYIITHPAALHRISEEE